jgi:iron complex outermembrane receptor protein
MDGPLEFGLFVTNLTKKEYYTFTPSLGSPQVGFETATVGEPRMIGGRLKFNFGNKS